MSLISVIVPVYNEEELIEQSYKRITDALLPVVQAGDDYELLFVNDGSHDRSQEIIANFAKTDSHVKLISFSRNFGHQVAVSAGMDHAGGDAVVIIDADMQDPPEVIAEMVVKWREGYDVVYGKRRKRAGESAFKKFTAATYYKILKSFTTVDIPTDTGDFRLISRRVCLAMRSLPEHNRYVRGLASWVGFRQVAVEFDREARMAGETKYPLKKMIKLAMDGIFSFSYVPVRMLLNAGLWLGVLGFLGGICALIWLPYNFPVITFAICMFFTGIILMGMGILGEYITRITDEVRARPLYVVKEKIGFNE
ncbi:MAG: glycosyltransferase family 2 protein [Clostridiales bacterium]|jgi:dolichol-phosphate mannosyltransferase|nr:glycosyltransferase family 2 protein [Clostridiales bacterium]